LREKDASVSLAQLAKTLAERDERDARRAVAPLEPAADAHILDTTDLSITAVRARVLALVEARLRD